MEFMSITICIIAVTVIISLLAFNNQSYIDNLVFWPYRIWRNKEWHRLISCGFIHADYGHLFFNMFALFSFGQFVESAFGYYFGSIGITAYIIMYFLAVATADAYNLFKRKDDYGYRSLGASGGVSAVIFASILFNPFGKIYLFFIPVGIPAFIFGGLYLVYCAYMAKRAQDNIGHTAHFTGSLIGFFFPIIIQPSLLLDFISHIRQGI